jgi:hypothetical protein
MCTVSSDIKALDITVHNQHPSLELTSQVYFSNGTACHVSPSRQTDTVSTMVASFETDSRKEAFEGALLYKLQRKHANGAGKQSNSSVTSIENTETSVHLLVVWDIDDDHHIFCICLVEYVDDFNWDEDKLQALYWEYIERFYEFYDSNTITWLMRNGTVMKTRRDITYGSDCKLDIVLSEGTWEYGLEEPIKINPKRLVLPLSMLIMLMYALSLSIPLSFKLNIHNQCSNVDLVFPTYAISDELECHRPPDYKVCAGYTMKSGFIIKSDDASYGALIYRLQRRQLRESVEISEDASNAANILVVWEMSEFKGLYVDVLLVEHDKRFIWNKDDLGKLYSENSGRFRLFPGSATETWSLDDNVALMTTFKVMNEDRILDITVSEVERHSYARTPAHIDPER